MKKNKLFLFLLVILMVTLVSCSSLDSTTKKSSYAKLIHQFKDGAIETQNKKLPIAIPVCGPSTPNSAGGVDVIIHWYNISSKIIKYITFEVIPFNAVDDVVYGEITKKSIAKLKITGPIDSLESVEIDSEKLYASNTRQMNTWKNVWYNNNISRIEIQNIKIIYMDGTEEEISSPSQITDILLLRQVFHNWIMSF